MENEKPPFMTTSAICDALGRKAIAARLGLGMTAVSNASVGGTFPAAWFPIIIKMCAEKGIDCPLCVFSWRADAGPQE